MQVEASLKQTEVIKTMVDNGKQLQLQDGDDNHLGCHLCSYVACDQYHLYRHIEKHSKKELYSCKRCSFQSNSRMLLKRHEADNCLIMRKHCPLCPFKTAHPGNLRRHLRKVHPNEANAVVGDITTSYKVKISSSA